MAERDTGVGTYLKAFCQDWLTGMSGGLSVPFAFLAVFVHSISQKILWGCLAVLGALFASYSVWSKERRDARTAIDSLKAEREAEKSALTDQITKLSRKPYTEDAAHTVKQVLFDQMTVQGRLLVRHLLHREPIEVGRVFLSPEISLDTQITQLGIAMRGGIVRHREDRHMAQLTTNWIINPNYRPVLEDLDLTV